MAEKTIFSKIIDKEIPASIVYEDDQCLAFKDVNPVAPVHILLIPKKPIPRLSEATDDDLKMLGHMMRTAPKIAKDAGLTDFRLVTNDGDGAGQTVFHLHFHILGGRRFDWPPG